MFYKILVWVFISALAFASEGGLLHDATAERVSHGSDATLDNMDPLTHAGWYYIDTVADSARYFQKGTYVMTQTSTNGRIGVVRVRQTTNMTYVTADATTSSGEWFFVSHNIDTGGSAGDLCNIFVGDSDTNATEASYASEQDGSGTFVGDQAGNMTLGNTHSNPYDTPFLGKIAYAVWVETKFGQSDIRTIQWSFCNALANERLVVYPGFPGSGTQQDLSGNDNDGTITNSTALTNDGPPIMIGQGAS